MCLYLPSGRAGVLLASDIHDSLADLPLYPSEALYPQEKTVYHLDTGGYHCLLPGVGLLLIW